MTIPALYHNIARKLTRTLQIRVGEITPEHVQRVASGDYSASHPVEMAIANELRKKRK